MDAFTLKPIYLVFNLSNLPTNRLVSSNFFSFSFSQPRQLRSSSTSCSCSHSNQDNPKIKRSDSGFSLNPFGVVVPILQRIRILASSQTQKWASCFQVGNESGKFPDEYGGSYLQNGGIEIALLSVTTNAKVRISPFVATLASNPTFVSGLFAWFIAQSLKILLNFFVERKWDLRLLFASGGMPSSHSSLCTALTTSVALCHGVADSLFPVCLGFSLIVMYDAIGVRRHAGMQAEVLNMIVEDLFQGHPISQRKLKELLGHTPSQVLAGALVGIIVAWFCCQGSLISA